MKHPSSLSAFPPRNVNRRFMKLLTGFLLVIAAGLLCGGEAWPEYTALTIHKGKASGPVVESGRTSLIKTVLRDGTLDVDIRTDFTGEGTLSFDIPESAKKIRLFGCEYDLPPPDHTAFFRAVLMADIRPSWWRIFEPVEIQHALLLISFAPDRKSFNVQIYYMVDSDSGKKYEVKKCRFFCIVAEDGQIFEVLDPESRSRMGPGTHYFGLYETKNQNGKLLIRLRTTGRFYKYFKEKELLFEEIGLPKPDSRPYTLFFLNMPFREKYLAENQSGGFAVIKSVAEFRTLAEKLKLLRCGMTPEETAAILGKPDRYHTAGAKGPGRKAHAFASYFFLNTEAAGSSSLKNLTVELCFEKDPDGIFRLNKVF